MGLYSDCWRAIFAAAVVCAGALAQQLAPAGSVSEKVSDSASAAVHLDRLCVKLAEGSGAELRDGALRSRVGVDLARVDRLFARGSAEPLVTAMSWDELDRLHERACEGLPVGRRPGHLGLWFRVRLASASAAEALRVALAEEPMVEHVYHEPKYVLAGSAAFTGDIPPTTPLFTSMQFAHDPPPLGHGVRKVAGIYGARGRDVGLRMLETSWILDHEDMEQLVAANFIGPVPPVDPSAQHGLSGSSIVIADRNSYGITGIADEMQARFVSIELNGGLENAMVLATSASQPGDVFLMVVMVIVPGIGLGTFVPVEFYQSVFDATLTATANGRIVVVPAGNGNRSLDDPALLNRFDRSFRDSGAIIVAASEGGLLQRASYSNWGSRIDAHSWGLNVVACGYGTIFFPNNDIRQSYTASAQGTSSSAPHLAGIVASMQGAAKKQLGHALTNAEILALLHTHGLPTPDVIGLRPDLPLIFQALGIFDGLSVGAPEIALGGTITIDMNGSSGSAVALFASLDVGDVDLGLNRHVHLDLATMASLGAFFLPTSGLATGTLVVPTTASLQGVDIFFQAARLTSTGPLHITNSCQVTIL